MPKVPQVKTCCLCCSTEIGSKIIGWFLLISGIIETISWIFILVGTIGHNEPKGSTSNAVFEVIASVIVALIGVLLLHGVYRKNMRYVRAWLTVATVYLVLIAIGIIAFLISGHFDVLNQVINFLLVAYFIVVVYSFYKENLNTAPATY